MGESAERPSRARGLIELTLFFLVLLVPLFAVWCASSLAAMHSGQRDLALVVGVLLFPGLPLLWELWAYRRRSKQKNPRPRILTLVDRLTLRTLAITLPFLVPMIALWPAPLFQALTTRGDWFLDDVDAPWGASARNVVLRTADGLVWAYDAVHTNPWRDDDGTEVVHVDTTHPTPMPTNEGVVVSNPTPSPSPSPPSPPPLPPPPPVPPSTWPFEPTLHPLAHDPPADALVSIDALGAYYAAQISDPRERAKAVHDYIADHVAYDVASYRSGSIPPQTAEGTFTSHLSVCAGYARLFEALGTAAGLHVETITGDARNAVGESESHAWNAIELDGDWFLVDTTWDAGSVDGMTFTPTYRSLFFLVPPEVMGISHFPDDPHWQLRDTPLTRGEWNRQPLLRPEFFADGLALVSPDRAQIDGGPMVSAQMIAPEGWFVLATVEPHDDGARTDCDVAGTRTLDIHCTLPAHGAWTVRLYASREAFGMYPGVASFDVSYL